MAEKGHHAFALDGLCARKERAGFGCLLGIMPQFRRRFRLADGRVVELDMAVVAIRLEGQTLPTICVFGEEGMDALLGAVTLEEFGLGVDPVNQRLVPIELLLVGFGIA